MAQDNGKFIIFPGGDVDPGENLKTALRREVIEETGVIINNDLSLVSDVKSDFYPEWASVSEKGKNVIKNIRAVIYLYLLVL
jgi:8-oxo-dGTP pyrophosphatase MutT (NUDIX family)